MAVPDKGDLVYMQFAHSRVMKKRPAIVLSPQSFNKVTHFAVVCPITRQKKAIPLNWNCQMD